MAPRRPFEIIFDSGVVDHLATIEQKYHTLIRNAIEKQLGVDPGVETRNRKPLVRPSILGKVWELRFGPENRFRVFYRIETAARSVHILAIVVKVGNRLLIGGKEFE